MKYRILNVLMPYGILIQASSCNGSAVGPPLWDQSHLARLSAIADLPGYTGSQSCGARKGHLHPDSVSLVVMQMGHVQLEDDGDLLDDKVQNEYNTIMDFIANAQ